jgi:hypothetical protein
VLLLRHHGSAAVTLKDITGAENSATRQGTTFRVSGPLGDDEIGPVVGTGDTAVTITDYALGAQIAEGTGAGQMEHLGTTISAVTVAAPYASFTVSRTITNNSGTTITVKECGLYCWTTTSQVQLAMILRDVLGAPLDVVDGGSITVDYTIRHQA